MANTSNREHRGMLIGDRFCFNDRGHSELDCSRSKTRDDIRVNLTRSFVNLCLVTDLAINPAVLQEHLQFADKVEAEGKTKDAEIIRFYITAALAMRESLVDLFFERDLLKLTQWADTLGECDPLHESEQWLVLTPLADQLTSVMFNKAIHFANLFYLSDSCVEPDHHKAAKIALALYSGMFPERLSARDSDSFSEAPHIERYMRLFSPSEALWSDNDGVTSYLSEVEPAGLKWLRSWDQRDEAKLIAGVRSPAGELKASHTLDALLKAGSFTDPIPESIAGLYKAAFYAPIAMLRAVKTFAPRQVHEHLIYTQFCLPTNQAALSFRAWVDSKVDDASRAWNNQQINDKLRQERQEQLAERKAAVHAANENRARLEELRDASKLQEFHKEHQKVPQSHGLQEFIKKLSGTAVLSQLRERKASLLQLLEWPDLVDYRNGKTDKLGDPIVKQVVEAITSRENLTRLLRCYGFEEEKYLTEYSSAPDSRLDELAEIVSKHYSEDSGIRDQVDALFLQDRVAVVMLASLFLSIKDVKSYIDVIESSMRSAESKQFEENFMQQLRTRITDVDTARRVISQFPVPLGADIKSVKLSPKPESIAELAQRYSGLCLTWRKQQGDCVIFLREDPKVCFTLPAKTFNNAEVAAKEIDATLARVQHEVHVHNLMTSHIERLRGLGADFAYADDEIVMVEFRPADLKEVLIPNKREWHKLEAAVYRITRFLEERNERLARAESLEVLRTVTRLDGCWKWSVGDEELVGGSSDIFISDFQRIDQFLNQIEQRQVQQQQRAEQEAIKQAAQAKKRAREALSVVPSDSSSVLIVDTSVLMVLLAPVDIKRPKETYLAVLHEIASRQNRRVLIPASVIFEVSGEALHLDASGKLESVKIRTYNAQDEKNIQRLIKGASHLRYKEDMNDAAAVVGASQLVIVHGPLDVNLAEEAKVHAARWSANASKLEQFALQRSHQQLGDRSISAILNSLPGTCRSIVATGDGLYVERDMPRRHGTQAPTQVTSWESLVTHVLTSKLVKSLDTVGLGHAPSPDAAYERILSWLSMRGRGPGKRLSPDGKFILGPRHLESAL